MTNKSQSCPHVCTSLPRAALLSGATLLLFAISTPARPLITHPTETVGRWAFESGFSMSHRQDRFRGGSADYETTIIPFHARFGATENLDIGVTLRHVSHRLKENDTRYSGSNSAQLAPEVKYGREAVAVKLLWHRAARETGGEPLAIGRGNDVELIGILRAPLAWPAYLNLGYVRRRPYESRMGITNGPWGTVKPGDIFQASASIEIPIRRGFSALAETVFYRVGASAYNDRHVSGSRGEAADLLIGGTWSRGGWDVGLGMGFGLLGERLSSFAIDRGAGDATLNFSASYRLRPRRPERRFHV